MINDRNTDRVGDAIMQMQKMVERFVTHSLKGDLFEKALECMKALREACVKEDEAPSCKATIDRYRKVEHEDGRGSHQQLGKRQQFRT